MTRGIKHVDWKKTDRLIGETKRANGRIDDRVTAWEGLDSGGPRVRLGRIGRGGFRRRRLSATLLAVAFGCGVLLASWRWADRHAERPDPAAAMLGAAIAGGSGLPAAMDSAGRADRQAKDARDGEAAAPDRPGMSAADERTAAADKLADGEADSRSGGTVLSAEGAARGLQADRADSPLTVRVYLAQDRRIERVRLEDYVKGVVAAEMPTDFKPAALEAQAIAARTYLIRRLWYEDRTGMPVRGADVTDTVTHQVYRSREQMDELKDNQPKAWAAVDEAVRRTRGIVMVYGGVPIESLYFASSNGYTENARDVFDADLPYLVSVASPWDKEASPRAKETVEMKLSEFYRKLGVRTLAALTGVGKQPAAVIASWTDGRRVRSATVGGKQLAGSEIRSLLGLRSAAFDWKIEKGKVVITTYGSGHGVGMSQWGAEGMAKTGATAADILLHYYSGIQLKPLTAMQADRSETAKL
ncbi:stage II sporulation protein D [Cohnella sp. 56]|uniref:stage II sporulation protein D n=1 Tax=Cohnella sp. 56 TaxID=3113722 RepID=UPI0030E9C34D